MEMTTPTEGNSPNLFGAARSESKVIWKDSPVAKQIKVSGRGK
jgi:hypothetical protein